MNEKGGLASMRKILRTCTAILLVAITACALPLSAMATTVSGTYNSKGYTCVSTGSTSYVRGKLTYAVSAMLYVDTTPTVYYNNGNTLVEHHNTETTSNYDGVSTDVSYTLYYTVANYRAKYPSVPANGFFYSSTYTYKINGHTVLSGWEESFI